jgi:hypothetical protein
MEIMNNTPRKCLGFKTPNEVFKEHLSKHDLKYSLTINSFSSGALEGKM